MEVDSPTPEPTSPPSPQDHVIQRLLKCGVPEEKLVQLQPGLVEFLKENKSMLPQLVSTIFPTEDEVLMALHESAKVESSGFRKAPNVMDQFRESLLWLQWIMFECEPHSFLKKLAKSNVDQRGVCGAVWGHKDIAYRCRTCENDPTCAICVYCFENGNHKDHDYSLMYTGGGCCDCGDVTAWKREGFCSKHKGAEQIQPLPEEIANSVGPVLDALLTCWRDELLSLEKIISGESGDLGAGNYGEAHGSFSSAFVEMLLDFCKQSESLLSFISKQIIRSFGLLDVLLRAEQFLGRYIWPKLHELLLKLLGEPIFKYEFAKAFIRYYSATVSKAITQSSGAVFDDCMLLQTFSVQIYTVPTLAPRLVKEVNLLGMLLGCLGDLFLSCLGEEGYLQISKWVGLFETTSRLVEDIRYVMSHTEVPVHVVHELPDISIIWIRILTLVQGMDPQKRVTGLHVEEENENMQAPFMLGESIGIIHALLVTGAFSANDPEETKDSCTFINTVIDEGDNTLRHAKVGRLSQESSVSSLSRRSSSPDCALQVPSSVTWLVLECLKAIDTCLGPHSASKRIRNSSFSGTSSSTGNSNSLTLRTSLSKIRKDRNSARTYRALLSSGTAATLNASTETHWRRTPFGHLYGRFRSMETEGSAAVSKDSLDVSDMDLETGFFDDVTGADHGMDLDGLGVLSMIDWPEIAYDVSSQDVSFHIPLHRLLSLLLQKVLKRCCDDSELREMTSPTLAFQLSRQYHNFFAKVLPYCHPNGFSGFMMEHPLRLRVFLAQVRAGMWRKNGDPAIVGCDLYHKARWLEHDLFLLQCCASLAPPDLYVMRIQERFGLSDYFSLILERPNEYEPVLVQEMLTLIIQIVQERRYCGFSTAENLCRELVCTLVIGDATRSQLVRALPRELSKSDLFQKTLDRLALYAHPSGLKQGKYSLRREFWKELDLYHPRWSSRDLQAAEERYLLFCNVSASTTQLPRWTKIYYPLYTISRIATSKEVLKIIRSVFFYAYFSDNASLSRAPDGVLLTALHLLSLALDICQKKRQLHMASCEESCMDSSLDRDDSFPLLDYACEEIDVTSSGTYSWKHQSMLSLLVLLMRKYKEENERTSLEVNQCNLSSLIENLLKRIGELDAGCMRELGRLAPDVLCHLKQTKATGTQIVELASDAEERRAKIRERQAAILEKMKAAQSKFIASINTPENAELDLPNAKQDVTNSVGNPVSEESPPVICSLCRDPDSKNPVSFLILLQKSRLTTFVERGPLSWEEVCKSHQGLTGISKNPTRDLAGSESSSEMISTYELAHAVNEFARGGQPADTFLDFITTRLPAIRNIKLREASHELNSGVEFSPEMMEDVIYQSIQSGIHNTILHSNAFGNDQMSLTSFEESSVNSEIAESALLEEYVASLFRETAKLPSASEDGILLQRGSEVSRYAIQTSAFDGFGPTDCDGIHVSSCGHAVHPECRDRYLSSLKQRFVRRIVFERGHIVDPDQGEFLCPVCRRLANSVLPALSDISNKAGGSLMMLPEGSLTSTTGSSFSTSTIDNKSNYVFRFPLALSLLRSAANEVGRSRFLKSSTSLQPNESITTVLHPVFHTLCRMYYPETNDSLLASRGTDPSLLLWDTLRYSLISTEIAARGRRVKLSSGTSNSGLHALYKEADSSAGFILSTLLHIVQATRSQNHLLVLLRFRGIQLFTGSISGISTDEYFAGPSSRKGNLSSILRHVGKGAVFPGIEFWKRAAGPVLAHDPFSSLMWVLFCLPRPFLSSTESFIALVHLFYVVCVIQALITLCLNRHVDFSKLRCGNPFMNRVCEIMEESVIARQYFVSSFIDSSCNSKDTIRRFTFPYLRRCGLLWKLLKSSKINPFSDSSNLWDRSFHMSNDNTNDLLVELSEVSEVEQMFQIFSLDAILNDKVVQPIALKWCEHFCKDLGVHNYGRVLHMNPAIPFKLVRLPLLYQELLQRFIKQHCSDCNSVLEEPALCLLCGRLCSPSWKPCCRENEFRSHAMSCGAGVGVFLLIRKTSILLQRSARQARWPSPYLDAYGEEDIEMSRGRPLYLNEERYAALTHMVASHGLDRSSDVLRLTTVDGIFVT